MQASQDILEVTNGGAAAEESVFDLVIIIVNWNVKELLVKCLQSVLPAVKGIRVEVVVVDNASTDDSIETLRQTFPEVKLIANQENVGFAQANNQVLREYPSRARFLLLLNPDTVVPLGVFHKMIGFMDGCADAGIVGCKIVKPNGELDWPCKRSYLSPSALFFRALGLDRRFPQSKVFGGYHLTYLSDNDIHEVASVVGAFMMIRRECLQEIGVLDESYFMYGEDIDWCYRAIASGWKVYYVPTATIVHYKGESSRKVSNRMIYYWYDATWRVYRQHLSQRYVFPVNALIWAGCKGMCWLSRISNWMKPEVGPPRR